MVARQRHQPRSAAPHVHVHDRWLSQSDLARRAVDPDRGRHGYPHALPGLAGHRGQQRFRPRHHRGPLRPARCAGQQRGHTQVGAAEETTEQELRDLFEVHFHGPVALTVAALPHFRRRRSGAVVQLSSVGGQVTAPGFSAYCSTRFRPRGLVGDVGLGGGPVRGESADRRAGGVPHRAVHPRRGVRVGRGARLRRDRRPDPGVRQLRGRPPGPR
ncbi:MAG TPA: SDR family NAD(P)-dependent oxidoreductase [Pseudonocardia sp.]|nr:SDR family NAD(P)-dependent oxidoreductase [Pseudonocardia sp.]